MVVLETDRLTLRHLSFGDAAFVLELLNEPSFIRYIGDKGVRNLEDACEYLRTGPLDSYAKHGYGLFLTALTASGTPIGLCGLVKRDELEDPDVGFAFLPQFWSNGYGSESAAAILDYGRDVLGLGRILAITSPDNAGSIRLLEKIGLNFETMLDLSGDGDEVDLFAAEYGS